MNKSRLDAARLRLARWLVPDGWIYQPLTLSDIVQKALSIRSGKFADDMSYRIITMASAIRAEVDRSLAPFGGGDVAFEYTHDHDGDACLRVTVTHVAPALRIGCPRFDALVKECNDMSYRIVKMAHDAGEERIVYVNNRFPA